MAYSQSISVKSSYSRRFGTVTYKHPVYITLAALYCLFIRAAEWCGRSSSLETDKKTVTSSHKDQRVRRGLLGGIDFTDTDSPYRHRNRQPSPTQTGRGSTTGIDRVRRSMPINTISLSLAHVLPPTKNNLRELKREREAWGLGHVAERPGGLLSTACYLSALSR